ncbi:MAG TPA: hypothetical protein VF148_09270 [Acidimicrobiia bacterium]
MIWKGLGVLLGSGGLIVAGVVGLALWLVPDEPAFSEGFAEASETSDGTLDFVPTAIGGELEVSGAREGSITLERNVDGPSYGLGDERTRIFFEPNPLTITQMSYDGLAFFPEPDDCAFTAGENNEEIGVAAARVVCPDLVDIRDNGTISLQGYVALPSDMIVERDLPEIGGTVTVGEETWEMAEANLGIYPPSHFGASPEPVFLDMWTGDHLRGISFEMDRETEALSLAQVYRPEGQSDVPVGACSISTEFLVQVNPNNSIHRLDFACDSVAVRGMGKVPITGSVVFYKSIFEP